MRTRNLLALPLLLVPSLLVAQIELRKFARPVVAATVTIPAMSFSGDLGGVGVTLGYSRVNTAGYYLDLNGPVQNVGASSVTVGGNAPLPAGNYYVRFDFVNVGYAMSFNFAGPNGATIGICSLASGPGYNTVQTCALGFSFAGGNVLISVIPTSGIQATLRQVTVTRYQ